MSTLTPPPPHHPHHHQFEIPTNETCDDFLYTRDEVLKYIKSLLQPVYNSGSLTDTQFVFIAKQTLLFVMSSASLGVRRYSKEFVTQVVQLQLMHIIQKPHTSLYIINSQGGLHENGNDCNDINDKRMHSPCKETTRQHQQQESEQQQERVNNNNNNNNNNISRAIHPILSTSSPFIRNGPNVDSASDACNAHSYYYPTPSARQPIPPSRSSSSSSSALSWCSSSWPLTAPPKNINMNMNNTNNIVGYNSTLPTTLVSSHGVKCRIIPIQSNSTVSVPSCGIGNGIIGIERKNKNKIAGVSFPPSVSNMNSDDVVPDGFFTLPNDSKQQEEEKEKQEKQEKKQIYQGENEGKDQQWVDNEDATLLNLLRQLRERIESINPEETETPTHLPKRNLFPPKNKEKVSDDNDIASFPGPLTPIPTIKPVSSVLDFVNHAVDMHDFMQKWTLGRQEILRSEEHAFMSLLLQLQQSLIFGLMHHISLIRKDPKDLLISSSSPPPPTTPPPNTQFISISPYNAINDNNNEDGRENDNNNNESFKDKKITVRQTTAAKSLYIKRFLHHENPSNETTPVPQIMRQSGSNSRSNSHHKEVVIEEEDEKRGKKRSTISINQNDTPISTPRRLVSFLPVVEKRSELDLIQSPAQRQLPKTVFLRHQTSTPIKSSSKTRSASYEILHETTYRLQSPKVAKPECDVEPGIQRKKTSSFTKQQQQQQQRMETKKQSESKEKRRIDREAVVEYLRQLLQPAFDSGALSAPQMGEIVKRVSVGLQNGNYPTNYGVADAEWKHHLRVQVGKLLGEALIGKT